MKKMKKIVIAAAAVVALAFTLWTSGPTQAAAVEDAAALYKTKCASCHGADGNGTAAGKKLGAHTFQSMKGVSDAELLNATMKGKNKMPGYEKTLGADKCKALVAYIRSTFMK